MIISCPPLRSLDKPLYNMIGNDPIPDNFPDGRVIGILLENKGSCIQCIKVDCKEEHSFQRYKEQDYRRASLFDENFYEFHYRFCRDGFGKPLQFKVCYEVESGFKGYQIWVIEKGKSTIKRIKPKGV